ncbi:hypothetical protein [Natrinema longum]|uniref:Uncharacterized protein n=1 Tax=Natrinema longum TaxID=370324 RepID=A0A8A2U4G3_9EURY|nr:hypothetical protein [Natrinema longum]MBZ6494968.1 hypothetical protein [Natrinema longum]QSW83736.1 hypothetical protein J0X27_09595 [Natrinema longum]
MNSPEISRLAAVLADLRDRGYRCPDPVDVEAPVVATGGDHPADGPDAPLSVERVREVTPLSLVSGLADAAHAGHAPVLVVDEWGVEDARAVLGEPFLLRGRRDGRRRLYSIPDRIALTDGRYACVRTDANPQWREESVTTATALEAGRAEPSIEDGRDRTGTDEPRLVLKADGTVQAALAADALTCPGPDPDAFPYRYGRGADKRIHVFDRDREVGRYAGIAAMKGNAYRPVSLPLLPEHHVKTGGRLARSVTVAVVTADGVEYERP